MDGSVEVDGGGVLPEETVLEKEAFRRSTTAGGYCSTCWKFWSGCRGEGVGECEVSARARVGQKKSQHLVNVRVFRSSE